MPDDLCRQRSSPSADVKHRQHGEGAVGILRQITIADLGKTPQALVCEEWGTSADSGPSITADSSLGICCTSSESPAWFGHPAASRGHRLAHLQGFARPSAPSRASCDLAGWLFANPVSSWLVSYKFHSTNKLIRRCNLKRCKPAGLSEPPTSSPPRSAHPSPLQTISAISCVMDRNCHRSDASVLAALECRHFTRQRAFVVFAASCQ